MSIEKQKLSYKDTEDFDSITIKSKKDLKEKLQKGLDDIKANKVHSLDETFQGKCIAVIHRTNDNDDKLIIVLENKTYSNDAIKALTEFQERFFESIIIN